MKFKISVPTSCPLEMAVKTPTKSPRIREKTNLGGERLKCSKRTFVYNDTLGYSCT